jgi:hypothetical protein
MAHRYIVPKVLPRLEAYRERRTGDRRAHRWPQRFGDFE